jgi:hypothetical protein
MTNWEWAALSLWCIKNGFQPRGNTDNGRDRDATFETGGRVDGTIPGVTSSNGRVFGGSGPASWRHNNSFQGIADLVGNLWEWQGGFKAVDGQIYMPNDNDFALAEAQWPAQGVYFDASAGPGDGEGATSSGTPILSNGITKYSETPNPAGGGDNRNLDYTIIDNVSGWQQIGISSGYNTLTAAVRQRMAQALIAPKLLSTDTSVATGAKGTIRVRNYGERFLSRGGAWSWGQGGACGLGALFLYYPRSNTSSSMGFRPAFSA